MQDLFGNPTQIEASENDYWYTPRYVWQAVNNFFGTSPFDPCPENHAFDNTERSVVWPKDCYINPPYSEKLKRAFVNKAMEQYQINGGRYLWFFNYANSEDLRKCHRHPNRSAVVIPDRRIAFVPGHASLKSSSPMYDNIFILWGNPEGLGEAFDTIGTVNYK